MFFWLETVKIGSKSSYAKTRGTRQRWKWYIKFNNG